MKVDTFLAVGMVIIFSGAFLCPVYTCMCASSKRFFRSRNQVFVRPERKNTLRQACLPCGICSGEAIICEWNEAGQPTRAMFRSGKGRTVTAPIVSIVASNAFLQHKHGPIFRRKLTGERRHLVARR